MGRGGGSEGADGSGSGSTEGGREGDVDVASRISDWREKKQGENYSDSCQPSEQTVESEAYPRFDRKVLGRFSASETMLGQVAFRFFSIMMPLAVVALLVKQVRRDGRARIQRRNIALTLSVSFLSGHAANCCHEDSRVARTAMRRAYSCLRWLVRDP